ncbi:hypothetical protein HK102_011118 [Quaeritorhiza haematococci]|nr:hypothetical protein HK102_011118 [Quaeritorhiza haematococci]
MSVNQLPILGFASDMAAVQRGDISLQSIRSTHQIVCYRITTPSQLEKLSVLEPFHDSNKLYASMSGLPTGEITAIDLEDFGIEQKAFDATEPAKDGVRIMGSNWLQPGDDSGTTATTRIAVAVRKEDGKWVWVNYKMGETRIEDWNAGKIAGVLAEHGLNHIDNLVLPVLQPKRVITPNGVVFVG